MQKFKRLVDIVDTIATWLVYITITAMVVMVATQVVTRYLLHSSLSFTEELARYMFIWSVSLGAALALKQRKHVNVSIIVNLLPEQVARIIRTIADLLANIFFLLLLIFGSFMVSHSISQTSPALGMSFSFVYLAIPVSAVILVLNGIYNAWSDFKGLETKTGEVE